MATVKATVDIQFHPKGEAFSYQSDDTVAEAASLKKVLAACERLKVAFDLLIPKAKRTWWSTGITLKKEKEPNGHVATAEIVEKLNAKMKNYALTRKQLKAIRLSSDLPTDLTMDGTYGPFPPEFEKSSGLPDEVVLSFAVAAPMDGIRVYYGHPDGSVTCCFIGSLTMQGNPTMVAYKDVQDGRIDVVMATHFEVTAAGS
jgi:hypothetical protein